MTRPLTEPLLRALVGEACADSGGACVLAVAAAPVWDAAPVLETGNGRARVVPCVSALAVREALRSRAEGETLVILTDRDEADLGQEVLARLWQQHVRRPSGWEALRHLFRVDGVDPALADHRWMVDLLVDIAPPRGYPPPPSGFLDLATAWRTLVRHGLRLDDERPSAADLLRWGLSEPAREASRGPLGPHLGLIGERLARDGVDLAPHVLRLVAAGRGEDLVAFGLVCDVLWSRRVPENPQVTTARIRFEGPLGARDLPPRVAQAWGAGAVELVRLAEEAAEPAVPGWLARTEHLLATDLDALELAAVSDVLPGAFGQRLGRAGRALGIVLDGPTDERLERLVEAADLVGRHLRAGTEPERVRALRMAVRLARRTVSPPALPAGDLGQLASQYVGDGAWVDAARDTLAEGETVEVLAEAYGRLAAGSDADRRRRDQAFAAAFAAWSTVLPSASRPLLPIERVLDEIVAPVARQAPRCCWCSTASLTPKLRGCSPTSSRPGGRRRRQAATWSRWSSRPCRRSRP